ncbi:FecR family protein [Kriegella aquimaris]|uniref:FecR family protein n=1 Tax=Kriegella aquimaris TaxID=192904 RepID=A0A1G9YIJ7_9FLAO|nr:FecR family protein [Kriegella aquimaris]SDN08850.1 FecR family protein [Kriegella aquimaris]
MPKYHLLIDKYINSTISSEERKELEQWVLESDANRSFFKNRIKESSRRTSIDFDAELAYQRFSESLKLKKKVRKPLSTLLKYAALIAIVMSVGFLAKRQLLTNTLKTSIEVVENEEKTLIDNAIVIKLADGTTKVLNTESKEAVTDANGNVVANKGKNSLVFDSAKESVNKNPIYNEIFIPNGEIFKLQLSDGTLVWLNAGSKLRFPQNFDNACKKRIVYLEGEAFFDVAKNKEKPFIVNTQEVDVKVQGTQFNINSYENDDYIATTLVEGSVSVYETRTPENTMQLTPSFQANYDKFGNNFIKAKVDVDKYTGWMQNRLVIDNLKFPEILIRLERRYAVKFVNNSESLNDELYKGEFVDEDIASVLKTISMSTPFNYEINQNIITITE